MDTITIKQKKYEILKVTKSQVVAETPGILAGAKILTNGFGGNLKIFDARTRNGIEPLLSVECKEGRQENEQILIEPRKYEGGIAVQLEGINAEALIYHKPFDIVQDIHRILEIKEKEEEEQWIQEYNFNLDTATTNKLIDQFPTKPNYLYVKEATGVVTVKFTRPTGTTWTLSQNTKIKIPFDGIYLTWTAQSGKDITFYLSNKDIVNYPLDGTKETAETQETGGVGAIGWLSSAKGFLRKLYATLGITTGARVVTDAAGTVQQYLRGLVSLAVSGFNVIQATAASLNATVTPVSWLFSPEMAVGTTVVKASAGQLHGVLIETDGTNDVSVQLFNHASTATNPMTPAIVVPGTDRYGGAMDIDCAFSLGCVIVLSGTNGVATVYYR